MRILRFVSLWLCCLLAAGSCAAATEQEARDRIEADVRQAFFVDDFDRLEAMSNEYRTTKSRTSSGLWKLTLFYSGLRMEFDARFKRMGSEDGWRDLHVHLARWSTRYPDSPAPRIAESIVLMKHAWQIRGGGWASEVKPQAWEPFHRQIRAAGENLERYKAIASKDPCWYETMLAVAKDEAWERGRFDKLVNEALDREPLFYQTYFRALEYLLPIWNGSTRDMDAFVQDAVRRTSAQEGRGMYARIYWYASQVQFGNNLFRNSEADWARMRDGFDDVVARYPDAWNLSHYAMFACLAGDQRKTREILTRVGSAVVADAWDPPKLKERCIAWATQP